MFALVVITNSLAANALGDQMIWLYEAVEELLPVLYHIQTQCRWGM